MNRIILVALALGVLLAGCTGDDESTDDRNANEAGDGTGGGSSIRGNMTVREGNTTANDTTNTTGSLP